MYSEEIILVDSFESLNYDYAIRRIRSSTVSIPHCILGFDCEWVNDQPVSLIQLATSNGFCAVFRIGKIGHVPPALDDILANDSILKVGVAALEDGKRLWKDYNVLVVGTLDLRHLANYVDYPSPKSLADLSSHYLGIQMDKNQQIRCGNWNADILNNKQIDYAARDALVSALVYEKMKERNEESALWKYPHLGLTDCR